MSAPLPDSPAPEPQAPVVHATSAQDEEHAHEVNTALRNGLKLAASLFVTYGIALAVRFLLPRTLGPDAFGEYNWAESLAMALFMATTLGIDIYTRKEVSIRPEHASEFFGGTLLVRIALACVLMAGMAAYMLAAGEPTHLFLLAALMGLAQFFLALSNTLAAVLHARGQVDGLSLMNIAGKALWGVALLGALFLKAPLVWLGVPLLLSEALKTLVLYRLASRHAGLRLRLDVPATRLALVASLPLFLNELAVAASGRIDGAILGHMVEKREVGYHGAAWGIATMTMMLTPILGWVLMPMLSRAARRSREELFSFIRRALEATVSFSTPITLAMAVGAEVWIELLYGRDYLPASLTLQIMAPAFVLTYVASVSGICLTVLDRAWTVTRTSLLGLALNPVLNIAFIHLAVRWGEGAPGSAAAGASAALALAEALMTALMVRHIGDQSIDRRTVQVVLKTLAVCAVVVALDVALRPLLGPWRLLVSASAYVVLVLATGAVRLGEFLQLVHLARNRRQLAAEAAT